MIKLSDIKYRVGSTGKTRDGGDFATFLIYIDARTAMDELDAKFGELNWQFKWEKDPAATWAIRGILKVWSKSQSEWVEFHDVGYPEATKTERWDTNTSEYKKLTTDDSEWQKDAISDAMKRCAVQVGIGRELYRAPFLYTEEVKKNKYGKVTGVNEIGKKLIEANIAKWYEDLSK